MNGNDLAKTTSYSSCIRRVFVVYLPVNKHWTKIDLYSTVEFLYLTDQLQVSAYPLNLPCPLLSWPKEDGYDDGEYYQIPMFESSEGISLSVSLVRRADTDTCKIERYVFSTRR